MTRIAQALHRLAGLPPAEAFNEADHPWGEELLGDRHDVIDIGDQPVRRYSALNHTAGYAVRGITPPPTRRGRSPLDDFNDETIAQLSSLIDRVFLPVSGPVPRSVAFASGDPAAFSGPVVAAVAELLAQQTSASVAVLDAKLSRRSLHECFGVAPTTGLAEALVGGSSIAPLAVPVRENLSVLCAGANAGPINLARESAHVQLERFFASFDYVLVDTDPVSPRAPAGLAALADGVILVLDAESTQREAGRRAVEFLRSTGASVIGAVLIDCDPIPARD
jgi:Mrp family chromosome partitioning ATPase